MSSYDGGYQLRLGDMTRFCDRAYIDEVVRFVGQYLDKHITTESNASEFLKAMKAHYQQPAG